MLLTHKIALDPNNEQKTFFSRSAGVGRFSYNWALGRWKELYAEGKKPNEASLRKELNAIKRKQFPWMLDVSKNVPQQAIKNLGTAFQRFFEKKADYPQFKKKGKRDAFRADNGPSTKGAAAVQIEGCKILVPRLGWVKTFEELRFKGQVKSLVISFEGHRWYASVAVELSEAPAIESKNQGPVGVDLGAIHLATLSTGEQIPAPKPYKRLSKKLKRLQRKVSRRVKGSVNRKKAVLQLRRLHEKIANIREESLHQLSHMLTLRFNVIGIEDLNVSGMLKNHCLAGTIADLGFSELRRQLIYKAKFRLVRLVIADRWFPSSKLCSECHVKNDGLQLSMREWTCASCQVFHDRDINAAVNLEIYAVSSTVSACGEESPGPSRKRETKLASGKQELNIDPREQI